MAKIPTRLHGPAQVSNAAATKYTVPAGRSTVVRKIRVQNPSAAAATFTLSIGADAAGVRLYDAFSIPAQAVGVTANILQEFGPFTLAAGEIIQAFSGTNNILVLEIDGDEFVLG